MVQQFQQVTFIQIDTEYQGQRIDNFLFTYLKGLPKTRVYRLLRKGEIRVNKKRVKPNYRLLANDQLRIPPVTLAIKFEPKIVLAQYQFIENRVIYENKRWLVINKPQGLAVHGGSGQSFGLIEILRKLRSQASFLELVHRLDKATSGCLLVAKKNSSLRFIHQLLRDKQVNKVYLALVAGDWAESCEINQPLQKNILSSGERMVTVSAQGKASITLFKPLYRFGNYTLVQAYPKTGRTHQIRVHAKYAGHTIIGDEKYGNINKIEQLAIKRLFLHAFKLEFADQEQTYCFKAPLDDNFTNLLDRLDINWRQSMKSLAI